MPEIALADAAGQPVDLWRFFRGQVYTGGPVPVTIEPASAPDPACREAFEQV
jgi:hypothetical protein